VPFRQFTTLHGSTKATLNFPLMQLRTECHLAAKGKVFQKSVDTPAVDKENPLMPK
jgi:hypothetical protein